MKPRKVVQKFTKPSRTVSSEAYNHDINAMIAGKVPFTQSRRQPFYIDETVLPESFEAARDLVLSAQGAFMRLAPEIREKFANDPALLARALADPRNHAALTEMGVLEPQSAKPPVPPAKPPEAPKGPQGDPEGGTQGSGGREASSPPKGGSKGDAS